MPRPVNEFLDALEQRSGLHAFTGTVWRPGSAMQNACDLIPLKYVCVEFRDPQLVVQIVNSMKALAEVTRSIRDGFLPFVEYDELGNQIGAVNPKVKDYRAVKNYGEKMLYMLLDIADDIESLEVTENAVTWNCQHPSDAVELYRYIMSIERHYD